MKYIKLFDEHSQYESYTADTSGFILPNVSYCIDTPSEVHYNPYVVCEETSVYEIVSTPSYPSEIGGSDASFDISFNYKRTDIDTACTETVTEGSDSVTVECGANPSTSDTRTVSGTVTWNGNEIGYSLVQNPKDTRVVAKFNVTSTSSPTPISYYHSSRWGDTDGSSGFSAIEIDGVEQPNVITSYTFSTLGEHTVKYTLKDNTSIVTSAFYECSGLTSITLPNGVTSIGIQAFFNCTSLTSITIPDTVTTIGNEAFYYCGGLTSCTIGSGVTTIGERAFSECYALESIVIPDSVTSIGSDAFLSCSSLSSCTIGSGVTSIGNYAFSNCNGLTSITVDSGNTVYDSRNNCNAIIETNTNTLIQGYKNTIIPDSVTSIGNYAFANCSSLTSIEIPDSVTTIGNRAFQGCSGLTSIDIPSGVTSIGEYAFNGCTSLTSIVCNATTAPTIQSNTFLAVKTNGILYVPQGNSGYNVWMRTSNYYLGLYNWTGRVINNNIN